MSTKTERTVIVTNVFGDDNVGGAAITEQTFGLATRIAGAGGTVKAITVADWESPADVLPSTTRRYPSIRYLRPAYRFRQGRLSSLLRLLISVAALLLGRSCNPTLKAIRDADIVISKGGYVFVERGSLAGCLSLWFTAFPLLYASRCGVATATFPTTVGPFTRRPSRLLNRYILRRTGMVVVRDELSERNALALGLNAERVSRFPDGVFSYCAGGQNAHATTLGYRGNLGLVVRTQGVPPDLSSAITAALLGAVRELWNLKVIGKVTLILQTQLDQLATEGFEEELRSIGVPFDVRRDKATPQSLCQEYADVSLVLTSRLHGAIFASIVGTPAIALSLDGVKTEGAYAEVGLPLDWVIGKSSISPTAIFEAVCGIANQYDAARQLVVCAVASARDRLVKLDDAYLQYLEECSVPEQRP